MELHTAHDKGPDKEDSEDNDGMICMLLDDFHWFSIGFHDLARPLQKPSLDRMFVETSKAGLVTRNTKNQKAVISSFNMFQWHAET